LVKERIVEAGRHPTIGIGIRTYEILHLACALGIAFEAIGCAAGFGFVVSCDFADAFFDLALELIAGAFHFARRFRGVVLGLAFGLQVGITGQLANTLLDAAFELVDSLTHRRGLL
jgi:hypothetical protein